MDRYRSFRSNDTFLPEGGKFDGKGEYVTDCPRCGGRWKLYWNPARGLGHCFGSGCDLQTIVGASTYKDLFEGDVGLNPLLIALPARTETATTPRPDRTPCKTMCAWDFQASRYFLSGPPPEGRALTEEQVREVPIGGDGKRIWVQLDPLSREYRPESFERSADGSGKWLPPRAGVNRGAYSFGLKAWLATGHTNIILVEGVFDVLSTGLYGRAVAVMGSTFPDALSSLLRASSGRPVKAAYWPDADPAGEAGASKAMKSLKGWGIPCKVIRTPKLDPKHVSPEATMEFLKKEGYWD